MSSRALPPPLPSPPRPSSRPAPRPPACPPPCLLFLLLPHLACSSAHSVPTSRRRRGSRYPLRFHLSTDRGSFPVELTPRQADLLRPAPLPPTDFHKLRTRLSGMHESSAVLPPRPAAEEPARLAALVLRCVHAAVVGPVRALAPSRLPHAPPPRRPATSVLPPRSTQVARGSSLCFSSAGVSDDRPMLIVLTTSESVGLKVSVHAEDAIGGNILLDEVKVALAADDS